MKVANETLTEIKNGKTDTTNLVTAAKTQAQSMADLTVLAKKAAKLNYGAQVNLNAFMGMYHSGQGKKIWVIPRVQNDGKGNATVVSVAVNLGFLPEPPKTFSTDFVLADQSTLPPFINGGKFGRVTKIYEGEISPKDYPAYKRRTLYVWGNIRYRDYFDETIISFCVYTTGQKFLEAKEEDDGGYDIGQDTNRCVTQP